jgi:hypothetical protein
MQWQRAHGVANGALATPNMCCNKNILQRQPVLLQHNVIMAIFLTYSNTSQKRVAIQLTYCNDERKYCNELFLWQESPPIATVLHKMLQNIPLLQHNLWRCKGRHVAIGSKSSSGIRSEHPQRTVSIDHTAQLHCNGWTQRR